jgi:membrane-associated phospholipid phosphatase
MDNWLWNLVPWGYQVLLRIEEIRSGGLTLFFSVITDLGSSIGYLVILSLVYWCVSKYAGLALAYCSFFSATFNVGLKQLWAIPRPGDAALDGLLDQAGIQRRVTPLREPTQGSFPSQHAQGAAVTWGYVAHLLNAGPKRRRWAWMAAIILAALIAFSRLYLGVHLPQDVIAGLAIGAIYLAVWLWAEPRARRWLARLGVGWQYALALLLPLATLAVLPGADMAAAVGAAAGMGIGAVLERQTIDFSVTGKGTKRALRGALGLALVLVTYAGLRALFGLVHLDGIAELAWRALCYALLGLVDSFGAPWVFVRTRLANRNAEACLEMG